MITPMNRRTVALALALCVLALGQQLEAQPVTDLAGSLYADLRLWQDRGLIHELPALRPYPIQLVRLYLLKVRQDGNSRDQVLADRYLSEMQGRLNASAVVSTEERTNLSDTYEQHHVALELQGSISPVVSYATEIGEYLLSSLGTNPFFVGNTLLPQYERSTQNIVNDNSVAPLSSLGLYPRAGVSSDLAVGTANLYAQAGLIRSSFGPFWGDNAVLSPYAPEAARFSMTWRGKKIAYSSLLQSMSGTNNEGSGGPYEGKYLILHSLSLYPLSWLRLGIFETALWGPNFDPRYLLPAPTVLFYARGRSSSSLMGISGGADLPSNVRADLVLYVDDIGFNELIRLDFNAKFLGALETGVSWTPDFPFLTRLTINNLLVTPYTYAYSHAATTVPTDPNYWNYTNDGVSIGPSMEPNSDRIEVEALLRPTVFAEAKLFGRYILHGNASDINGTTYGNGSIFDQGIANGTATFESPGLPGVPFTRFLAQPVLERTFQTGATVNLHWETSLGEIGSSISYTFQQITNLLNSVGDPESGLRSRANFLSMSISVRF